MNRKSLAQEYFILATDIKGNMSAMYRTESKSGMVAAGLMDLLLNEVISLEKKKITVVKELPEELLHLGSLYAYLHEKPRSTDKLMSDYIGSTAFKIQKLTTELGDSLLEDGAAVREEGGLFGKKTVYIPDKDYKDELISIVKSSILNDDDISAHDITLLCILKETKNINQYFSKHEGEELNSKIKEIKKNPQNKQLNDMINYINNITTLILAFCLITSVN